MILTQTTDPGNPYLNIKLQWDHQQLDSALNQSYRITISPPTADSVTIYNTFNTFVQLALLYNQDYNISVVAKSCIGNSMPDKICIRIRDDVLTDNYLSEVTITTLTDEMMVNKSTTTSEMILMANKSTNDSTSGLDPQQNGLTMRMHVLWLRFTVRFIYFCTCRYH